MTDFELTTLEYLRDCVRRGLREATIKYYRDVLERFSRVSAITQLSQLTLGSIRDFQDELAELSPGSVKGFVSALKTFSKWAHEERHDLDPLAGLRLPRSDRHLVIVPTDEELVSLMAASAPLLRTVVTLVAGTGLRISDVVGLDLVDDRPSGLVVAP
jgi:site-specific recombinase XerD